MPKNKILAKKPFVSVLIPARNEEKNIGTLLEQLSKFKYPKLEIIVCNDNSTDSTADIIKSWAKLNSNIKLLNGEQLPKHWLGKNFACHQLAQSATGDVLLFLDSDVSIKEACLTRSISYLKNKELHLLSIFPKQIFKSLGEKISVPLMNWILLSLLPLNLIRRSNNPAFSAANGQFMLFNSTTYKSLWPHKVCKFHKVEDIAILRLFKEKNLVSDTRLGDDDISCRMYNGLNNAIDGFTKNIFQFFGNSILVTVAFGIITTVAPFLMYFNMGIYWLAIYLVGVLLIRIFVSLASQQSLVQNIVLAIPQHLVFLLIIGKGLINNKQKKIIWKGRNILQE